MTSDVFLPFAPPSTKGVFAPGEGRGGTSGLTRELTRWKGDGVVTAYPAGPASSFSWAPEALDPTLKEGVRGAKLPFGWGVGENQQFRHTPEYPCGTQGAKGRGNDIGNEGRMSQDKDRC